MYYMYYMYYILYILQILFILLFHNQASILIVQYLIAQCSILVAHVFANRESGFSFFRQLLVNNCQLFADIFFTCLE
jgi:hypothetical protein